MNWKERPQEEGGDASALGLEWMEPGATAGCPPGFSGLSLGRDSSVSSITLAGLLSTFQIKNVPATRAERGWKSVSQSAQAVEIVFLERYFLASLKMFKNSAGPRFLCVPGSAERFVLPKEKMASSIVFRPFSSGTRIFPKF